MKPNPSAPDCEAIEQLIPDYVFGLTSADETRLVEAQLDSCADAAAQVADFRGLQDEMRASVTQVEPPPGLRDKLLAAIAAPEPVVQKPPRKAQWGWLVAAAVVALIVSNAYWLARVGSTPTASGGRDLAAAQIAVQGDSTFVLSRADSLRWVRLPPSGQYADASAVLMWNVESDLGLLYVRGFPTLAAGKAFQLWLTKDDTRASAGTFRVDENGNGALLFHLTDALDQYTWARITEEPANGSSEPSDQVVVVGEL